MPGEPHDGDPAGNRDHARGGEQPAVVAFADQQPLQFRQHPLLAHPGEHERPPRHPQQRPERGLVGAVAGDVADDRVHGAVGVAHGVEEVAAQHRAGAARAVERDVVHVAARQQRRGQQPAFEPAALGRHELLLPQPQQARLRAAALDGVPDGADQQRAVDLAVAAGAQDYLVKGKVDGPLLIRAVRYAVERRRAETSVCGCARSSSSPPSPRDWNAASCPRRCSRAATCTPSPSTARAAPGRCWAATSSTPSRRRRHRARDHRRRLRPRARRGRARRALRVSWRALCSRGGRGTGAARAAAAAGHRAARTAAVHDGVHDHDSRRPPSCGSPVTRRRWRSGRAPMLTPPVGCRWASRRRGGWPPCRSRCPPAGRCCSTRTASSRPATAPAATSSGSRACWSCSGRPRPRLRRAARPARRAREAYNGGPLIDDVAILLLGRARDLRPTRPSAGRSSGSSRSARPAPAHHHRRDRGRHRGAGPAGRRPPSSSTTSGPPCSRRRTSRAT